MRPQQNASRTLAVLAVIAASTATSSRARAAGFANVGMGGEQGTPVSTNTNALYFNPGALGFSEGTQLGMYGSIVLRDATWTKSQLAKTDLAVPAAAQGANTGEAKVLNFLGGVSAFGGTARLGNLVIGAGFFAPFVGNQTFSHNDAFPRVAKSPADMTYPLAANGIQRFFGDHDYLTVLYFTAGAAYRLGPLSIGAAGNFISTTLVHSETRTYSGSGNPNVNSEGTSDLNVSGFNGSFSAGAMLEVLPEQLWLGVSYQSQPGLGTMTLSGDLNNVPMQGASAVHYNGTFTENLPDVIRAGVRLHPKHTPVEVRVFGDITRWSKQTTNCSGVVGQPCNVNPDGSAPATAYVLQNNRLYWNDTKAIRVGISYWTSPNVELFVGGGYETAAAPDATMNPDSFDLNTIQGSIGTRFRIARYMQMTFSYTHFQGISRNNTGKSELSQVNGTPVQVPTVQEDAGGVYTDWRGQLSGALEVAF